MSAPLLTTKLYIPAKRPNLVSRQRLLGKLDEGQRCKLTLVSAPAGFGKTTLISDWISQRRLHSCWITLDESDNDLGHFLAYLIASLRSIYIEVDEQILTLIQAPGGNQVEDILIPLINQIASVPKDFILVLDDYHTIEEPPVHQALSYLLEHAPASMHFVLLTRADPAFSLSHLGLSGEMVEIRAAQLRLEKLPGNVERDRRNAALVARYQQRYRQVCPEGSPTGALLEFRWLIEELRVSLFAQELGTSEKVSSQRLDRMWSELAGN